MPMSCIHAIERWPRAHASGYRLVVRELRARAWIETANRQVVHRALARGRNAIGNSLRQSFEDCVDYPLRGFDVTAGNCRRMISIDDGSLRRHNFDGLHQATTGRHFTADQTTEAIRNCRSR